MRIAPMFAIAACASGALVITAAASADAPSPGQRQMDRMLAGKAPGEAQDCIWLREIESTSIIDDTTVLYRDGRTVYRNDIPGGCPGLARDRTIVTRQLSSGRLCEGEQIRVVQPQTGVEYGVCAIGSFTPYTSM